MMVGDAFEGAQCNVLGCNDLAEVSVRFGGYAGQRRYCASHAQAAEDNVAQPKLVKPDWYTLASLGAQAADAGKGFAIECRSCGARSELESGQAVWPRCPDCGSSS